MKRKDLLFLHLWSSIICLIVVLVFRLFFTFNLICQKQVLLLLLLLLNLLQFHLLIIFSFFRRWIWHHYFFCVNAHVFDVVEVQVGVCYFLHLLSTRKIAYFGIILCQCCFVSWINLKPQFISIYRAYWARIIGKEEKTICQIEKNNYSVYWEYFFSQFLNFPHPIDHPANLENVCKVKICFSIYFIYFYLFYSLFLLIDSFIS